tara:strand:- start:1788 stop:2084 length:297 start_codon:yes stop_codon:yes gene_type:complete
MGIFDKKKSLHRREFKDVLGKDQGIIPGTGGSRYSKGERDRIGREVFGPKYGSDISKHDFRRAVGELELSKGKIKDEYQKKQVDKKIRYLKGIGGKNL